MKVFVKTHSLGGHQEGSKVGQVFAGQSLFYSGLRGEPWLQSSLLEYMVNYVTLVISPIIFIHLQFRIYRFFFLKVVGVLQSIVIGMQYTYVMTLKF